LVKIILKIKKFRDQNLITRCKFFEEIAAEMMLKTDESEGKILKIFIKIKKMSEKFRNMVQNLETFLVKIILKNYFEKFRDQNLIPSY